MSHVIKNKRFVSVVGALSMLVGAAVGVGYWAGRARAAGVPASMAMTYSGALTDANGTPLTGSKNILVQLYDMATMGTSQCTVGPTAVTLGPGGSFSIPLPDACTTAIHATPDLWVEVFVDNTSFGRSKLGAVPYALEAATASAAAGSLAQAISKIPTLQVGSAGYVTCQPLTNFAAAGYNNLLVRGSLYSDSGCATDVTTVSCHPWCAAMSIRDPAHCAANCCGVAVYYTAGVVDILQWK
jgi:hypothetical protein